MELRVHVSKIQEVIFASHMDEIGQGNEPWRSTKSSSTRSL